MDVNQGEANLSKGSGLVLVVDDEPIMRKLAVNVLQNSGYHVLVADSGIQAISVFKKYRSGIDLVLLDLLMPEMSGKETFIELNRLQPGINVLLVSGAKKDERILELLEMGVKGFVEKPYTFPHLSRAVFDAIHS